MYVAKSKALISCGVTTQLICAFAAVLLLFSHLQKAGFLMTRIICVICTCNL